MGMVKKWVGFYKTYRDILISDIVHVRRPDMQGTIYVDRWYICIVCVSFIESILSSESYIMTSVWSIEVVRMVGNLVI